MRYFHQPPGYWLDNCTLQDWRDIYSRELREVPPVDEFAAAYFKYRAPGDDDDDADPAMAEEWVSDLPDVTE